MENEYLKKYFADKLKEQKNYPMTSELWMEICRYFELSETAHPAIALAHFENMGGDMESIFLSYYRQAYRHYLEHEKQMEVPHLKAEYERAQSLARYPESVRKATLARDKIQRKTEATEKAGVVLSRSIRQGKAVGDILDKVEKIKVQNNEVKLYYRDDKRTRSINVPDSGALHLVEKLKPSQGEIYQGEIFDNIIKELKYLYNWYNDEDFGGYGCERSAKRAELLKSLYPYYLWLREQKKKSKEEQQKNKKKEETIKELQKNGIEIENITIRKSVTENRKYILDYILDVTGIDADSRELKDIFKEKDLPIKLKMD
ncbi:hypothetical protein LJC72_03570 [Bacteroides sp. OttesenSCG-928-D19]|nr:hypothetical protein [Bacteroides sp. OttesenSCG-928-D19]